jgi:hypothetical protein
MLPPVGRNWQLICRHFCQEFCQSKKEFKGEIMNFQEVGNVVGAKDYFFTLKVDVHEPNSTTTTTTTPPTTTTAPPAEVIF